MSANGKFFCSVGPDGARTWIQSNDLVSIEDEQRKQFDRDMKQEVGGGAGQEWGERLREVEALDLLQETVDTCYVKFQTKARPEEQDNPDANVDLKTATQAELMRAALAAVEKEQNKPWEAELENCLTNQIKKPILPDLIRALPVEECGKLEQLLGELLS